MKKSRKLLSMLLSVLMLFALCGAIAYAADEAFTITIISDATGHSYEAYQVFAGDLTEGDDGSLSLSNISWGAGVDSAALLEALKLADAECYGECHSAEDLAYKLNDSNAAAFAALVGDNLAALAGSSVEGEGEYSIFVNGAGYYFVKDEDDSVPVGGAYTKFILELVDDAEVKPKTDAPTVDKEIKEADTWGDAANASIGDSVSFRLVAAVPDMSNYQSYFFQFNDTLSAGLSYNGDARVSFEPASGVRTEISTSFSIDFASSPATIKCTDIKAIEAVTAGGSIVVEYTATLNENAVIAPEANTNKLSLTYSNNPNNSGKGSTEETEVKLYTYELALHKYDADDSDKAYLAGAKFELYSGNEKLAFSLSSDGQTYTVSSSSTMSTITTTADGPISIEGLDAGAYTLKEIEAPGGYNKLASDISFTIYADESLAGSSLEIDECTNTLEIANKSGATLPSTGGRGTTVFTLVGLALMLGAALVLVAKRRSMDS